MSIGGLALSRDLLANMAGVLSILLVLFASPLLLGCYVVVQRASIRVQLAWFGGILLLLGGALVAGAAGLLLLA